MYHAMDLTDLFNYTIIRDMAKRGRPPKEPYERLSNPIVIKVTISEKEEIDAAAKKAPERDRASWLRKLVLKAARRLNGKG
jgi:hypothetical protein